MDHEGMRDIIINNFDLDQSSANEDGKKSYECVSLQSDEKQKLNVQLIDVKGEKLDEEIQANLRYEEERKILLDRVTSSLSKVVHKISLVNRQLNYFSSDLKKVDGVVAVWEETLGNSNATDQHPA